MDIPAEITAQIVELVQLILLFVINKTLKGKK